MTRTELSILNAAGTQEITNLTIGGVNAGEGSTVAEVRVFNVGPADTTATRLYCVRGEYVVDNVAGEDEEDANAMGKECIDETWVEARLSALDPWTPLDARTNFLDLGAIAIGGHVTIFVRINPANDATTVGGVDVALALRSRT